MNRLGEMEKLDDVVINLQGDALAWFQWANERRAIRNWPELKAMIQEQFRPTQEGSAYEQFLALRQIGSVDEYCCQFELLVVSLIDVPNPIQEGNFINGLKPEIKVEVRMAQPKGLGRIIDLAKRVKERNEMLRRPKGQNAQYGQQAIPGVNANFRVNNPNTWTKTAFSTDRNPGTCSDSYFRRLTEAKILEKREKGLCCQCDEKFSPRHVC